MNIRKLVLPSLAVLALAVLSLRATPLTAAKRPRNAAIYDEIEAALARDPRQLNVPGGADAGRGAHAAKRTPLAA